MPTGRHRLMTDLLSMNPNGPQNSWKSKKQSEAALSTCEAEYMSLSLTCLQVEYLTKFSKDLVPKEIPPALIYNDNQRAIALIKNPVKHSKSKHIDFRYHFFRECYENSKISIDYVPSNENIADVFTKPPTKKILIDFKRCLFRQ